MENLAVLDRAGDHTNEQRRNEFKPPQPSAWKSYSESVTLIKTPNIFILSIGA
jgi:hypothetical protein